MPKEVMFTMDVHDAGRAPGAPKENEVGHTKLEDMVNNDTCDRCHAYSPCCVFDLSKF